MNKLTKLSRLLELYGYESDVDFAKSFIHDSIVPGICMNEDCEYTGEYEPDQDKGWCDECNDTTVCSGLILMGLI